MEASRTKSFFQDIRSRELNGFRVRKRPLVDEPGLELSEAGALAVEHDGEEFPPLAVSFCKTSGNGDVLALTDENGYLSLFNPRRRFRATSSPRENKERGKISEWVAHQNAIFDVCWIKDDTNLLTASGDQTIKLWDTQEKKCKAVLMGHTGSIKSLSPHPTNSDVVVSGSRDGSFALWDLRCNDASTSKSSQYSICPTSMVKQAHISPHVKRIRRGKSASMSITSVLYLKDEVSIATAGAVNSIVKFWDVRNLRASVTQACPKSPDPRPRRLHGVSSMSQDSNGVFLTAACMDSQIYLYNILQLDKGPVHSFTGCRIDSFFIKSTISPDAAHILSGSSDGKGYIWQVNKPNNDPIEINGHEGEVTAVDWCTTEAGKLATCSDDFTVRIWNMQSTGYSNARSPLAIRRRVMAMPNEECRQLDEERRQLPLDKTEILSIRSPSYLHSSQQLGQQTDPHGSIQFPSLGTPKAKGKNFSFSSALTENFDKTPEAASRSPSSVLNPPSSLKRRTIRDYFIAPLVEDTAEK